MTWLAILKALLHLVALVAQRAGQSHIERVVRLELEMIHDQRVEKARRARGDIVDGRVPDDPADPYRRD